MDTKGHVMDRIGRTLVCLALLLLGSHAAGIRAETVVYYHTDALGSPVAVTDANRNVIERTQYAPYGDTLNRPLHDGPGYTGHETDAATGLVYAQQRYYDPVLGRFLSADLVAADPNNGASFNRYWYADNSPYGFKDPDGRDGVAINFPDYPIEFAGHKWTSLGGHSGVLLIDPRTGRTKYYEFGRYSGTSGVVLNRPLKHAVVIGRDGLPTEKSLARVLGEVSHIAGHDGRISGAYFANADYKAMSEYAEALKNKPGDKGYGDWSPYNSCETFVEDVLKKGGVDTPSMISPRPSARMQGLQETSGASKFSYDKGAFQGVFRVEGRLDSRRLEERLSK